MNTTAKTRSMVQLSLMVALLIVLDLTNIGFIRVPPVAITIMHIPVIIGAILMGPLYGGILGGAFGFISLMEATLRGASPIDLMFSPFASGHPVMSVVMAIVPRVVLGVASAYLFRLFVRLFRTNTLPLVLAAVISSFLHSALVLGILAVFFQAFPLMEVFLTIVSVNGLLEIALAGVLAALVCKPLLKVLKRAV